MRGRGRGARVRARVILSGRQGFVVELGNWDKG